MGSEPGWYKKTNVKSSEMLEIVNYAGTVITFKTDRCKKTKYTCSEKKFVGCLMLSILRTATLMEIFQSSLPRFVLSSITSLVLFDDEHDHFVLFQRLISYSTIIFSAKCKKSCGLCSGG